MVTMRAIEPSEKCDRCGHTMRRHATPLIGMICMVGRSTREAARGVRFCPCDGFVPETREA